MHTSQPSATMTSADLPHPDRPLLMLGSLLAGTYELRSLLGSGGMAQVFEAHDLKLDRVVAIKVARPASSEALRMEGRMLAAVRHPSIVAVFHAGTHQGVEYVVMERIAGRSLRAHLDRTWQEGGRVAIHAAVELLVALATALAAVHDAGLAHRDFKPDNVMLAPGDRVVLTDFGLTLPEFLPGDGHVAGSPSYMAPEIIALGVHPGAGHLVDLYALGIVAYELLTGQTPFERDHWLKTLQAHLTEPPRDPRELRPDVPDALARLVLELLAKEPEDRPDTAEWVAHALTTMRM